MPLFDDVPTQVSFPELEREIIEFWREARVFERSLEKDAPRGPWTFYEGPPTANGKPGVHHVSSRAFKDLFPRFKTMQGFRVGRKGGWDTHGLPVEIAIEKRLGFESKQEIEDYGIEKFNALCREYVFENIQAWNEMTERIGFWLDLEDAYVTYTDAYIESCWWVFSELWKRGLLVEDYKTTWHSPSSNTTLASHEVSLGYEENYEDPSVYPKFPTDREPLVERGILPEDETRPVFFLAWTTTPWTLAANTGLAVKPGSSYVLVAGPVRRGEPGRDHLYLLAEAMLDDVFGDAGYEVLARVDARELEGLRYRPILRGHRPPEVGEAELERGWRVVVDDFVTLDDGTGVVHLAPAYGDLDLGREHDLPTLFSVDLTGEVMPEVTPLDAPESDPGPYAGRWFKDADDAIADDLLAAGLMFRRTTILHTYPLNWRDGKPLMNVAKKSWYIKTTALKDRLLENNDAINWNPDHIRTGRFGKWLENNVDWAISRERYWGCPLPIWETEDGAKRVCAGSVAELERLSGRDLSDLDLHRPYVDEVTFEIDGETYRRVPYTVDVWFESGAMPYAQWHYMGEPGTAFERNFPADYICEAVDQTRGWFYSLHAIATLLTDSGDPSAGRDAGPLAELAPDTSAFENVIVLGHILDGKGEKMSKSKGNIVDPWSVLDAQGADALRWYLYSSSPPEASKRFSAELVDETLRDFFLTLWNVYGFFVLYANLDEPDLAAAPEPQARPLVDRWLLADLNALVSDVTDRLEDYDPTGASRAVRDFVVDRLSNWYVRRNRRRFWKGGGADALAAYATLHTALVTVAKLMAPMAPFVSDAVYRNLAASLEADAPASVHLASWPEVDAKLLDPELQRDMAALVRVVELGRAARAASGHKTRQPLPEVLVRLRSAEELAGVRRLESHLMEELNVKAVRYLDPTDEFVDYDVKPNLPLLGPRLGPKIPLLKRALDDADGAEIAANVRAGHATSIDLDGEPLELEPEAFLLDAKSPAGYEAAEERGYLAAIDTELTPELVREGRARDVVRLIQNTRKNAGYEVSDRIVVGLELPGQSREAVAEHRDSVAEEVLAESLTLEPLAEPDHREEAELDDGLALVTVRRA